MRYANPKDHATSPAPGKLVDIVDLDEAEKKAAETLGLKKEDLAGLTWKQANSIYKKIRDWVNSPA